MEKKIDPTENSPRMEGFREGKIDGLHTAEWIIREVMEQGGNIVDAWRKVGEAKIMAGG